MTIDDIETQMINLTTAAHTAITDWSDTQVRGYLKEHPDIVEQSVTPLERMLTTLRERIAAERANNQWGGPLPEGADTHDFAERTTSFAEHTCNCDWCLCSAPANRGNDEPRIFTIPAP